MNSSNSYDRYISFMKIKWSAMVLIGIKVATPYRKDDLWLILNVAYSRIWINFYGFSHLKHFDSSHFCSDIIVWQDK